MSDGATGDPPERPNQQHHPPQDRSPDDGKSPPRRQPRGGCRGKHLLHGFGTARPKDRRFGVPHHPDRGDEPFVTGITNATGLAIDPHGYLYVSSRLDGTVHRVSPHGASSIYAEGMGIATGIAFDSAGNLYVGDRSGTIFKIAQDRQISYSPPWNRVSPPTIWPSAWMERFS